MSMTKDWGVAQVWNESLDTSTFKLPTKRNHLWASELGKAPIDVFLHMDGEVPSNPPNARSQRKFEAGNVFEWIVKLIFKRAGILIEEEVYCKHKYSGMLEVTGRCDVIAGGNPDFAAAVAQLKALDMPEVFIRAAEQMKDYFEKNYPSGLKETPIEIKSVSSFMFESILAKNTPMSHHRMQLFHYLKSMTPTKGYKTGKVLYICRDDLRMMEFTVELGGDAEKEYKEAIAVHSAHRAKGVLPPKEQMILYDEEGKKFTSNWRVEYSLYLTKLYKFKEPMEYSEKYKGVPAKWNQTIKRFREGKKMTKLNLERMKEIQDAGFDVAKIAMGKT